MPESYMANRIDLKREGTKWPLTHPMETRALRVELRRAESNGDRSGGGASGFVYKFFFFFATGKRNVTWECSYSQCGKLDDGSHQRTCIRSNCNNNSTLDSNTLPIPFILFSINLSTIIFGRDILISIKVHRRSRLIMSRHLIPLDNNSWEFRCIYVFHSPFDQGPLILYDRISSLSMKHWSRSSIDGGHWNLVIPCKDHQFLQPPTENLTRAEIKKEPNTPVGQDCFVSFCISFFFLNLLHWVLTFFSYLDGRENIL